MTAKSTGSSDSRNGSPNSPPPPPISRRDVALGLGSLGLLATGSACATDSPDDLAATIDARVQNTLAELFRRYPETVSIADAATAMLVMPLVTTGGLYWLGGGFGRGALIVDGRTNGYFSSISGSTGIQFGAQQYSHVVFFMTPSALERFYVSEGWSLGARAGAVILEEGAVFGVSAAEITTPTLAVALGHAGLYAGAAFEGGKYTRLDI